MNKTELLQAFQTYLEDAQTEYGTAEQTDLYSLFTEMAALRNEVKTESRHFKSALDEFKNVFTILQESQDTLRKTLDRNAEENRRQLQQAQRSMLLDILEVYDRLLAGVEALHGYTPSFWSGKGQTSFIDRMHEGQQMTVRRLEQLLARYQVQAIEVLNQPLDPHRMKVVETVSYPNYANGWVVEELRKGFIWEEQILRLAEVKVNKILDA